MRPSIIVTDLPVKVSPDLLNVLWLHMAGKQTTIQQAHAVTLNFKDPSYSATTGGFHPVEIRLTRRGDDWHLAYVTDFAYVGIGDYAELAKELTLISVVTISVTPSSGKCQALMSLSGSPCGKTTF